ncbi:MAG: hypothetical protein D6692_00015 [Planctomycetota bacterium]|nr:MAG: hypothetical protein D6692_00015 [Planctomycetota bacterium]
MKIAAVMSGQMRTLDECAPSLDQYILAPLRRAGAEVRLFVHAAADADAHKAYECLPPDTRIEIADQPTLAEKNYISRTGRGVYDVQSVLRQFWSWRAAWRMVERYGTFDAAIRLRSDSLYYNEIEPPGEWETGAVYVPRFSSFWAVCDRFGFGDFQAMARWHCILDTLDDSIAAGRPFHPETLVADAIGERRRYTSVLFSSLRPSGEIRTPQFLEKIGDCPTSPQQPENNECE